MGFEEWYNENADQDDDMRVLRKGWNGALENQWQPIETALKKEGEAYNPTHLMQLPKPPQP